MYFDALESTTMDEGKQMELTDLISNIGGTLGLFLGISALSLFEFAEIILEMLFSKVKKVKIKQDNQYNLIFMNQLIF